MGSAGDSHCIGNVLETHKDELLVELRANHPSELIRAFDLFHSTDAIGVTFELVDGSAIDIGKYWEVEALIERFPDCA